MHYALLFDVMLISSMPCLFVLLRVDEQVIEESSTQQVETIKQELIKGEEQVAHEEDYYEEFDEV